MDLLSGITGKSSHRFDDGRPNINEIINKAIENSAFSELQKQEKEFGFREKAPETELFFRKGQYGNWRKELPRPLVNRIISRHFVIMELFDYIDKQGKPK